MTSLEFKKLTCQSHEQDKKAIPLQQPTPKPESEDLRMLKGIIDRETLVSWLFLIGSLIFTLDSVLENLKGVSVSSILHLCASILFTIGSVLFIPNKQK